MSHMGTSHVGQMGCGSLEDVSALGTANILPVVSPFLTILMCGQPHSPVSVRRYECGRRFHTGKSGSALSFQRQLWLSISARRHNGGKDPDRCHSVARRTPLIGRRAASSFGSIRWAERFALGPRFGSNVFFVRGHKRTFEAHKTMSALPLKADI